MRKLTLASLIFLYLYSVIIEITYRVLVLLWPFSKSIRFFLRGRDRALLISDMLKEDSQDLTLFEFLLDQYIHNIFLMSIMENLS